mmetsp:Transcript_93503/g.291085  ORF Transcript_93503/g.291085 Transcript_93503/m.291085 type:complete len:271 (-) Transcript_93503:232-1044(-)
MHLHMRRPRRSDFAKVAAQAFRARTTSPTNFWTPPPATLPSRMALTRRSTLFPTWWRVVLKPTQSLNSSSLGFMHLRQATDLPRHWSERPFLQMLFAGEHFGTQEAARPTMPRPMKPCKKLPTQEAQPADTCAASMRHCDMSSSASALPPRAWVMTRDLIAFMSQEAGRTSPRMGSRASEAALATALGSMASSSSFCATNLGRTAESTFCSTVGSSSAMYCLKDLKSFRKQPAWPAEARILDLALGFMPLRASFRMPSRSSAAFSAWRTW